ncbi:membrane-bound O-acyltransferase family protein [Pseudobutyrivibrio ruminis]|uniref:Membrane-bound O-acyltransferase family protein n=2 Tax=Pseudobutyrivibrio ruminis TaxID=46206 RepID=A0A2G3DWZ4_9FIRM|nr:membrane-bound O-acyltransferase family protein [Pseudobutyrivibrio ruminis]
MLFNSYIFIFLFLPICIVGYFLLNKTGKYQLGRAFLLGMSLWFYGYFNPAYLLIIVSSVCINYLFYLWMSRLQQQDNNKFCKPVMIFAVAVNLGIIGYFKYMDFFIENVNAVAGTDWPLKHIMLPLGISFFTFQQISFIVDTYRGQVPRYDFLTYACYVTFFPQLVAGPIVTHDELVPQLLDTSKKKIDWDNMAKGFYIFAMGLGKKVLIADVFGGAVNIGYGNIATLQATNAIMVMFAYSIQLYFDFSGYCDMAIGLGKMLNIDLPLNFDSPYKALNLADFWNRWHMTLGRFFTRYVYIPLGGNRKGNIRTYFNIFIVFLLSGFWHGAAWTFVIWSVLNGLLVILTRMFKKAFDAMPSVLGWLICQVYFSMSLVFFRAARTRDAIDFFKQIFHLNFTSIDKNIMTAFATPGLKFLLDGSALANLLPVIYAVIYYVIALVIIICCKNAHEKMVAFKPNVRSLLWTVVLFVTSVLSFSGISTFLYFNF